MTIDRIAVALAALALAASLALGVTTQRECYMPAMGCVLDVLR